MSNFYKSRMMHDLYELEQSVKNNTDSSGHRTRAAKSGRMLLKQSKKVAQNRTASYRLMGVYYWLINRQKKALLLWNKSIHEGEHLGARLELSRTYFEIGKRLFEPGSRHLALDGIEAGAYLEMAKTLFLEMDLQWDLVELYRVLGDARLGKRN